MRILTLFLSLIISVYSFGQLNIPVKNQDIIGELVNPESKKLAIIIAGSGPTDMDGNSRLIPGNNNSLLYLAEFLEEQGVASFRYQKRGLPGVEGYPEVKEGDLNFDDLVADAVAIYSYFKDKKEFDEIGFIGHSEGSLIGMLAAKEVKADFFISLCGLGSPAFETLKEQMSQLPEMLRIEAFGHLYKLSVGDTLGEVNPQLQNVFRKSVQPYLISWFKYNPAKEIAELECPILLVSGTTDLQVKPAEGEKLKDGANKADLAVIKGMNHVLKESPEDRLENMATYGNPDLQLHPKLTKVLSKFLN